MQADFVPPESTDVITRKFGNPHESPTRRTTASQCPMPTETRLWTRWTAQAHEVACPFEADTLQHCTGASRYVSPTKPTVRLRRHPAASQCLALDEATSHRMRRSGKPVYAPNTVLRTLAVRCTSCILGYADRGLRTAS